MLPVVDYFAIKNHSTHFLILGCIWGHDSQYLVSGSKLFLLCVGTHDECDRWLNQKRGKSLRLEPENFVFVAENGEVEPQQLLDDSWPEEEGDEYEEQLSVRLSDADLRYIFSGICQG